MIQVAAIVVTFNRKEFLIHCIEAICSQKFHPTVIYIIDNHSTDGTDKFLKEKGIVTNEEMYNGISLKYIQLPINGGGSMGFHEGLKRAYQDGPYDYYWVMDDDGEPHPDCLKELLSHRNIGEYLSPLVIDIKDHNSMAFGDGELCDIYINKYADKNKIIPNRANPFNGILYSKKYIEAVGYPQKEMFIWGDEINYDIRGRKKGMPPSIICKAIHYHPRNRAQHSKSFFFGTKKVIFVNNKWKMYCRCCNAIYNYKLIGNYIQIIKEFLLYNWFFLFSPFRPDWIILFNRAFINGLKGEFGGHRKYMK